MKPTLAMEEKPAATIIQTPELENLGRLSKVRWMLTGFGVLLALLAVILVFQVLSYRELKQSSEKGTSKNVPEIVEKNVNYHIKENNEIVNEKVVVDDREEDITTDKGRMIFDYDKGIVVTKIAANHSVCYVATFNNSRSIEDVKKEFMDVQENAEASLDPDDQAYEVTGETVPRELLSPKSQRMCKNTRIVMTRKTDKNALEESSDRSKRARCCVRFTFCWGCTCIRFRVCFSC